MNGFKGTLPTVKEMALAKIASQVLATVIDVDKDTQQVSITDKSGLAHTTDLPSSALHFLLNMLTELGKGNAVNLIPVRAELTSREGSGLLNMPHASFIKLLDEKEIPSYRASNCRNVKYMDVVNYKHTLDQKRLVTLEELSALDQALGLMDE